MEPKYAYCPEDCNGCTCHITAPCSHCIDDHTNADEHPTCSMCSEILYEATENEIRWHEINCFELK